MTFLTLGLASCAIVAYSAIRHALAPRALSQAVVSQVLLRRYAKPIAVAVVGVELLLVAGVALGLGLRARPVLVVTGVIGSAYFLVLAAYLAAVVRRGVVAPCGCGGRRQDTVVDRWAVRRAGGLSVGMVALALVEPSTDALFDGVATSLLMLVTASTMALLWWSLPAALRLPMVEGRRG